MGTYTDFLEARAYDILPDDDHYIEKLMEVVNTFRPFDEALDIFIADHGYTGALSDIEEKVSFLTSKFNQSGIKTPRNIRKWFTEHKRIERKTAYQICFAFQLNVMETNDFFRRVCLQRGFDCHDVEEVIFFYAIGCQLSYEEAMRLIAKIPKANTVKINFADDILYTAFIVEELEKFQNGEELVHFIDEHMEQFGYNNATACQYINQIWAEIASDHGLAANEKNRLYLKPEESESIESKQNIQGNHQSKPARKQNNVTGYADSRWEIYLQILGLSGACVSSLQTDRSLKPVLKSNKLLHPLAEESFPDRDGLNKILNGEHVSYERVRKILILLAFYKFWVRAALKKGNYQAEGEESVRCRTQIDSFLIDAGYPELYAGNPFDWIILYAMINDFPLITFREYMRELFYSKQGCEIWDLECL